MIGQGRAGQGRAGQGSAGQGRAGQGGQGQNRTGQGNTKHAGLQGKTATWPVQRWQANGNAQKRARPADGELPT